MLNPIPVDPPFASFVTGYIFMHVARSGRLDADLDERSLTLISLIIV